MTHLLFSFEGLVHDENIIRLWWYLLIICIDDVFFIGGNDTFLLAFDPNSNDFWLVWFILGMITLEI